MLMPHRTRTRKVRRSLVSARAGAVSGRHFLLELVHVLGRFVMEEGSCSPGRWPPRRRRLQPRAEEVAELLNTILEEAVANYGKDFEVRLVSLACARVDADPLRGLDDRARMVLEKLLAKSGLREGRAAQPSWS